MARANGIINEALRLLGTPEIARETVAVERIMEEDRQQAAREFALNIVDEARHMTATEILRRREEDAETRHNDMLDAMRYAMRYAWSMIPDVAARPLPERRRMMGIDFAIHNHSRTGFWHPKPYKGGPPGSPNFLEWVRDLSEDRALGKFFELCKDLRNTPEKLQRRLDR